MSEGRRVLVVDDDAAVREFMAELLGLWGYAVHACGPVEGVACLTRWRPALVISDMAMPELDGSEVAAQVRARLPGVPVLLYSAQPGSEVFGPVVRDLGAQDYLQKPFDVDVLRARVAALIGPGEA